MGALRFDWEWLDAPGVRDRVLASTWARLSLTIDGRPAFEAIDLRSESRRTATYGSVFPLAEWIVENWWHILNEPSPAERASGGRAAPAALRPWTRRHNLLTARDGGALPDLTIAADGAEVVVSWEPDPALQPPTRLQFVGLGVVREDAAVVEGALSLFVEAVLNRLAEKVGDDEDARRLAEGWSAILAASGPERELCRSLAVMGVDPYDPGAATDSLVDLVERSIAVLPRPVRADLLEGSDARTFEQNLAWVEERRTALREGDEAAGLPAIGPVDARTAHQLGYAVARRVRSELLGVEPDAPVADLSAVLEERLGWVRGCSKLAAGAVDLEGMVGLDAASGAAVLWTTEARSPRNERFRLARAVFFPVTKSLGGSARLLTRSQTPQHRASRAFAAELLAPSAALAKRVCGRLGAEEVEELADEFGVNPLVITHQVDNHGLGYVEA